MKSFFHIYWTLKTFNNFRYRRILLCLFSFWSLYLIVCENLIFSWYIRSHSWPTKHESNEHRSSPISSDHHILIVADPQLSDGNSYKNLSQLSLWFVEFYCDLFMRRSYRRIHAHLQPHAVFFLGDLFDGGRHWNDFA